MSIATRDIMDGMFEAYLDASLDPDDIPKTEDPVWILGKQYNAKKDLKEIREDISSRLWFTYRKGFVPIGGAEGLTSDKGWGCMLRCGQMVLAQALINLELGRNWIWDPKTKDATYLKILQKFEDKKQAPYSIHQIALMGASEGKDVGQWFGPNTVAQVLKKLLKYDDSNLTIHVALDNTIIISEIRELCCSVNNSSKIWKPLLLIVPLRLGLTEINPIYISGLQKCFQFKQSLGVIGGKPNLALYFIGCVKNEVIYLDPHTTQTSGFVENKEKPEEYQLDTSYHIKFATRMNMLSMDPSVAACFYCKTEQDFLELCQLIKDQLIDNEKQALFELSYDKPKEWEPSEAECLDFPIPTRSYDSDQEFEIL